MKPNIIEKLDNLELNFIVNNLALNKIYTSHYFNHDFTYEPKLQITSFEDIELNCYKSNNINLFNNINLLNKIKDNDNIKTLLRKLTFNSKHIFHDEKWLKLTSSNNFLSKYEEGEYKYLLANSINLDDLYKPEIIEFLNNLKKYQQKYNFIVKEIINNDDDDDDDNNKLLWLVLYFI